jgi:hypothetical protein
MSHVHNPAIYQDPVAEDLHQAQETITLPVADPIGVALDILRRRFPTVCLWFGTSTRHWWAVANGHLIEALTPEELGRHLDLANVGESRQGDTGTSDRLSRSSAPLPPPAESGKRLRGPPPSSRTPPMTPAGIRPAAGKGT